MYLLGYHNKIPYLSILLPIGLSFHTFQAMSYTIEVYRGHQKAERHFGIYSLYVMFYPQLVAGPIERPQNMLHQFYEQHHMEYWRTVQGLRLISWGLFKKVVIADRLSPFVDTVYNHPNNFHGFQVIMATVFFTFQIFCDFSGYSDIALGTAQIMGFKLMLNFNRPYFSKSVAEFWKRWHISLSTWFRDYLYISLGGNRISKGRTYVNQMIVFVLSGLWHGANLTFIVWGFVHGSYLIIGDVSKGVRNKLSSLSGLTRLKRVHNLAEVGTTFALVAFAWIFFRAANVTDAITIIKNSGQLSFSQLNIQMINFDTYNFKLCFIFILLMELVHWQLKSGDLNHLLDKQSATVRWFTYLVIAFLIINFGVFDNHQFIYFQF